MAVSTASLLYILFLTGVIVFNITGNSLVCILILKNKAMKTPINWLLFHLAVADLLVAVFFIPPCVLSHFIKQPGGVIGDVLCKFITGGTLGWAAASASSFLLVAVAFQRYFATLHPFRSLSSSRRSWQVPLLWILAILLDVPPIVVLTYDEQNEICVENFPDYTSTRVYYITWSFFNSMLPICIMGYLYARTILHLRNRAVVSRTNHALVSKSTNKATKMLFMVTAIFIVCWTPPTVLCVLSPVIPGGYATVYPVTTASALLNSSVNPLVYTLHSQQFRKSLVSLVCQRGIKWFITTKNKEEDRSDVKCQQASTELLREEESPSKGVEVSPDL